MSRTCSFQRGNNQLGQANRWGPTLMPGHNLLEFLFEPAFRLREYVYRGAWRGWDAVLFRGHCPHAFDGSFKADGVADVAFWNKKVVLIAERESP